MIEPSGIEIKGHIYPAYKWEIPGPIFDKAASPVFSANINNVESKWQLSLLDTEEQHLSISIQHLDESNIDAAIAFTVLDCEGEEVLKCQMVKHNFKGKTNLLLSKCINRDSLDKGIYFHGIDNLTIISEITTDKSRILTSNELRLREFDEFEKLLDNEKFSDVIFNVGGKQCHAHKNILANRSSVFAAMFEHDMLEVKLNIVEIKDITYDVWKEMLRFIYSGTVNGIEQVAKELLVAADKYFVEGLKVMCEKTLCERLEIENALEYIQLADTYNALTLKSETMEFIISNVEYIIDKPELSLLSPDVTREILCALGRKKMKRE